VYVTLRHIPRLQLCMCIHTHTQSSMCGIQHPHTYTYTDTRLSPASYQPSYAHQVKDARATALQPKPCPQTAKLGSHGRGV
jgi:hypothetical protein